MAEPPSSGRLDLVADSFHAILYKVWVSSGVSLNSPSFDVSHDGGLTWTETFPAPWSVAATEHSKDGISLAILGSGLTVTYHSFSNSTPDFGIRGSTSRDGGLSWSAGQATGVATGSYSPKTVITSDGILLYFYIVPNGPSDGHLYVVRSLDGGATLGTPVSVFNPVALADPGAIQAPDRSLWATFNSGGQVVCMQSRDYGLTWSQRAIVPVAGNNPKLAFAADGMWLLFYLNPLGTATADLLLLRSASFGVTALDPAPVLITGTDGFGHHVALSDIAALVLPDRSVLVAYSRWNGIATVNAMNVNARSLDYGQSWTVYG